MCEPMMPSPMKPIFFTDPDGEVFTVISFSVDEKLFEGVTHQLRGLAGRLTDLDAHGFEGVLLGGRRARRPGDDGARVAHRLALGSGEARDVADDGLGDVLLDEGSRAFLGVAA